MDDVNSMFDLFEENPKASSRNQTIDKVENASANSVPFANRAMELLKRKTNAEDEIGQSGKTAKTAVEGGTEFTQKRVKTAVTATEEFGVLESMPRIELHRVDSENQCSHEVALPPGCPYTPLVTTERDPAREYPFILDPFQKAAIQCIENGQSVLVSAHTSAGKTVVAEYAIATSLRDKQRVIYTTPIKALSNQKYREFSEAFQDVGLMTGDVTINPTSSCLIMTTEILRSMLYRGSEVMREVAWVVFDEIHYMRDKERGVVWEETIIFLPDNVHSVYLSATIPNATQFAQWIVSLRKQPCHVVYTDFRPTPLQHYIFPSGGTGLHLVVDERGDFREENFNTAMGVLKDGPEGAASSSSKKPARRGGGGGKQESSCFKIVKTIVEQNLAPAIVFSFSRKDCEAYGMQMAKLDLTGEEEKKLVDEVFTNAIAGLSEEDQKLPQVEHIKPLLRKGIGIHHSGLLPLLKETIEILFSEGLLKVLFATETFAMGLNMPARTVLFTGCRKFDGREMRWITSGEYIQMSGRAGRRGLDDRGIVITMVDEKMSSAVGKELLTGEPDRLNSAFHLTYNTVLNLLRVEEINPEYVLERSFFQFQNYSELPQVHERLTLLESELAAFNMDREEDTASYHRINVQLQTLRAELLSYMRDPRYLLPFLQPGRLVNVVNGLDDFGWGPVINYTKKRSGPPAKGNADACDEGATVYVVDVLVNLTENVSKGSAISTIQPEPDLSKGFMQVVPVTSSLLMSLSAVRLHVPSDLRPLDSRQATKMAVQEVMRQFKEGVPLLDPIKDMGIKSKALAETVRKIERQEARLYKHPLHSDEQLPALLKQYEEKLALASQIRETTAELRKKRSLIQMDELKKRKRVLRRLGYATAQDVITLKGRVACEISSADELLLTELLFNNAFRELTPPQLCALVSCFVFQEKAAEMPRLTDELSGPLRLMQDAARRIARVSREAKLEGMEEDAYVDGFKPHMMDVVHAWATGATFAHVCSMTDVFEGSIIRCMRRLEETLRQLCQASKAIGNSQLENKFAEGISAIKRDIVFAASLYL